MSSSHHGADTADAMRAAGSAAAAVLVCALMLISSLLILCQGATSDPTVTDNPDDTRTVVWDFDESADYTMSGTSLQGGDAVLRWANETAGDHTAADYSAGTRTNVDVSSYPGQIIVDDRASSASVSAQPGAAGVDTYLSEVRPTDNFGSQDNLLMDSEAGKRLHIIMRFDLSTVPAGSIVDDATLWIYQTQGSRGVAVEFDVHRLTAGFEELEASWDKSTSSTNWTSPGGDYDPYSHGTYTVANAVSWLGMDVSKMVDGWISDPASNLGLILVPVATGGDNQKSFQSSDDPDDPDRNPRLVLNYTVPGGTGVFESRVLGPGTNSSFTSLSYLESSVSLLDDGFSGTTLSPKWSWMNDPSLAGGSYDVGVTRPGWIHMTGSTGTQVEGATVTCNYLRQEVTGGFNATTCLDESFGADSMGAGLLLYESPRDWMYIAKVGSGASGAVQAVVCYDGTSTVAGSTAWADTTTAHLRIVRDPAGFSFLVSEDGITFDLLHLASHPDALMQRAWVGLFMFSETLTRPTVDFDHLTVAPFTTPTMEVHGRVGNSTSTTDPTWEEWAFADLLTNPDVFGEVGRYVQYRVSLSTALDWYSPSFSGFDCWYERYSSSGAVETEDYLATDFNNWLTMATDETDEDGRVQYWYSTDRGGTWTLAGNGGSYSIASTEPYLRIRANIETYDTLSTPMVHSISATHVTAVSYLVVAAPETVVAGEPFTVTVYVKDSSDTTMTHWSGPVSLNAMDIDATDPIDTELTVTSAYVTTGGYVTIPNEVYTEAETILIVGSAQGAYGFSSPITVTHGPIADLEITPALNVVAEDTEQTFTAAAADAFGNAITDLEFLWEVDADLGTLNRYNGSSVRLYAGSAGGSGYLRAYSGGLEAHLFITISHTANAPTFVDAVPDQLRYEDSGSWTIDLAPYVEDSVHLDSELRWYVTDEDVVDVSGENRTGYLTLTMSTRQDLSGSDVLSLYVVDPDGFSAVTNFTVQILPVNDWPVVDPVEPLVVHHDVLYIYNMRYYVHDIDDDEEDLSLSVDDASSAYVSAEKLALHIDYPQELNGTEQTVVVTVSDGSASTSTVVTVTVSDDNVPVVIEPVPDIEMYQGETRVDVFDLDDYFADPDKDELFFSYGYTHLLVNISADNVVSFFAPMDWYGSEYIIFSATDLEGARVESTGAVLVHRVNQAPVIEGVPNLKVKHGLSYEFDLTRYVRDPDNDLDDLLVTTNDLHAAPAGMVLTLLYPSDMVGQVAYLEVTVSDGELWDSWAIEVAVGDNTPPAAAPLPAHSFQEDVPVPYPSSGDLHTYFSDADGDGLTFEVFSLEDSVPAVAAEDSLGAWTVTFSPEANWHGYVWFVVRATDPGGALVETMAELTVGSVPDAPVLEFGESIQLQVGVQIALDLRESAHDPDMHEQGLAFTLLGDHGAYATVIEGVLILEFPEDFLAEGEGSRTVSISVSALDPDGLRDTDTLTVTVVARAEEEGDPWLTVGMLAMAGVAAGSFVVAMRLRKEPFVVKDIMLIHNDGFLIGRAAEKVKGEVDEDVLSGMLTAVLNFVEDSMAKTQDGLRSFGFGHYKVLVRRGRTTYMAVVYEGDAPEAIEDRIGEFLGKVEKIYRKRIESWTGDMDTDFAGVELLLQSFVRENSRRGRGLNGSSRGGAADKK